EGMLPFSITLAGDCRWPIEVRLGDPAYLSPFDRLDSNDYYQSAMKLLSAPAAQGRTADTRLVALRLRWLLRKHAAALISPGYDQADQQMWDEAEKLRGLAADVTDRILPSLGTQDLH